MSRHRSARTGRGNQGQKARGERASRHAARTRRQRKRRMVLRRAREILETRNPAELLAELLMGGATPEITVKPRGTPMLQKALDGIKAMKGGRP